jgi:tol-pal system protein YbgF
VKKLMVLPLAASLAACSSLTPADDPVYLRITDIEARLIRIERVLENESLIALAGDITSLRNEVQQLLGQVETLGFELENQAEGNRSLYLDLDQRLAALEEAQARMATLPIPGAGAAGFPAVGGTDQQAYDAAFALIEQRDFEGAQRAFEAFLATYGGSPLRANAQYWLAEAHYAQLSYRAALTEFERVLTDYPQSNKVADALLKIGYCNDELGNTGAARQALMRVTREFPGTAIAASAQARLQQID